MHVWGHLASHPTSIFMLCKLLSLSCLQWSLRCAVHTPSGVTCPEENRPRGETCLGWEQAEHLGRDMENAVLKGMNKFFPSALLIAHPAGGWWQGSAQLGPRHRSLPRVSGAY